MAFFSNICKQSYINQTFLIEKYVIFAALFWKPCFKIFFNYTPPTKKIKLLLPRTCNMKNASNSVLNCQKTITVLILCAHYLFVIMIMILFLAIE